MSVSVVVVDDQQLVRAGIVRLLELETDVEVVGEAGDGAAAVDLVRRVRPDVALVDIRMPVLDGIQATRTITATTATKVVVLTTFDLDEYVYDALRAGASGFLLKDSPPQQLLSAVRV
ncbi:MAG TPA: response regulator transcription factor, partial [Propionibacteriaceae bacterium]|nr:response regulator transcription factor [Propionibacteriaceae bacterium]